MNSNLDLKQIKAKGHDEKDTYSVYGKRNYTDEWVKLGEELNESKTLGIIREYIPASFELMEDLGNGERNLYEINGNKYKEFGQEVISDFPVPFLILEILDTRLRKLFLKNYIEIE